MEINTSNDLYLDKYLRYQYISEATEINTSNGPSLDNTGIVQVSYPDRLDCLNCLDNTKSLLTTIPSECHIFILVCSRDIDECSVSNNGGCSHKCVNTFGSYTCECPDLGLRLSSDKKTCQGLSLLPNGIAQLTLCLDRNYKSRSNWELLAKQLVVDAEAITGLKRYNDFSPTERMIEYITSTPPELKFQEFIQVLLESGGSRWINEKHEQQVKLEALLFLQPRLISGRYSVRNTNGKVRLEMEHCAFNGRRNQWHLEVKCLMQDKKFTGTNGRWVNINELYPDAKVEMKHNFVYVTIDSPDENHEFAVFGTPEVNDKKRMQLGLFGEKPVKGKDWKIWAILFDDTMMAFEHVCEMEEGRGRQLLSTLGGLLVTNCSQDIEINLTDMELGWQIKGSKVKTIKSNDAWNSPENSTDFPRCYFEISHVDKTKQSFFCEVTASHKENTTDTDAMAFYEEAEKDEYAVQEESMACPDLNLEMHAFFQMFVIVVVYVIGSAFSRDAGDADQSHICDKNVD